MSTTGNEYERPGVNYPDREDADGAAETPGAADPARDEAPAAPPTMGEPAEDSGEPPAWTEGSSQGSPAATDGNAAAPADGAGPADGVAAPAAEPSHEAVGVGVVDGADHHGHDAGRDTLTVSEAQRTPGALGSEQEQRLPAMAQNNASDLDKTAGIVAQTRQDVGTESLERVAEVLRQRLEQAGVPVTDADIDELAHQVWTGDAEGPTKS